MRSERWRLLGGNLLTSLSTALGQSPYNIERNYEIHDKKMLVVVRCLEAQRHFLEGAAIKSKIWTDHKNLKYFMKVQKLNKRQARWALYLSRFNFMLKHVPESKIGKADSLSRRPDWKVGVEKDNENETLVKPEWLKVRKTETVLENHSEVISLKLVDSPRSQFEIQVKQIYNTLLVYILHQMVTWAVTCIWISNHNCPKQFNKQYYSGYQLICLISWPILIASRHDWHQSKGLFKGFLQPLRL